jgi:hypothetical protein
MLGGENETESNLQSDPKNLLTTEEDVANEIKEWMVTSKTDGHTSPKSYENAVEHIELKLGRPFFCFEATWTESQYVKTVLELWLEKVWKRLSTIWTTKSLISGKCLMS